MFVSTFTDPNATALVLSVSLVCDAVGIEVFFFFFLTVKSISMLIILLVFYGLAVDASLDEFKVGPFASAMG